MRYDERRWEFEDEETGCKGQRRPDDGRPMIVFPGFPLSDDMYRRVWVRYATHLASRCDSLEAERDEALAKSVIDERQCDEMTDSAGEMAVELAALTAERDEARESCGKLIAAQEEIAETVYEPEIARLTAKLDQFRAEVAMLRGEGA